MRVDETCTKKQMDRRCFLPGHKTHCYIDRMLFGRSFWKLHRAIDKPYLFMGRKHRALFHDGLSSVLIARDLYPGDPQAEEAAIVHCQIDMLCSNDPIFKKQLEILADLETAQRRKAKAAKGSRKRKAKSQRKPKHADALEDFDQFMRKIVEIKRLSKMLSR